MDTMNYIVTIIGVLLGSGGLATAITSIVSIRKYKAEAEAIKQNSENARKEIEQRMNESIRQQIMEISDIHKRESEELRTQNEKLYSKIDNLNSKINELMEWIVYDNAKYRAWLENELVKLKPDIEFPECRPTPRFVPEPNPVATQSTPSNGN